MRRVEAGEYWLKMARAEQLPNISLIMGYHNEEAVRPGPGFSAVYGGVIIPLKFSGINRGEIMISQYELEQSRSNLSATRSDAETGLQTAWQRFQLYLQKRLLFTEGILNDAERVWDAIVFSYQRGDVSLLEVLEAQRTMNEVYMNYYKTLSKFATSIVDLSKASGQWLVEF
jgi:outer membrane protein, heavy metal efflux system